MRMIRLLLGAGAVLCLAVGLALEWRGIDCWRSDCLRGVVPLYCSALIAVLWLASWRRSAMVAVATVLAVTHAYLLCDVALYDPSKGREPLAWRATAAVVEHWDALRGAVLATRRFDADRPVILSSGMADVFLDGIQLATQGRDGGCEVRYMRKPSARAREALTQRFGTVPLPSDGWPPWADQIACSATGGRVELFAVEIQPQGCLSDGRWYGWNRRVLALLLSREAPTP